MANLPNIQQVQGWQTIYMEGATIWSPGDVVPSYHGFSLCMIHAFVQGSNIEIPSSLQRVWEEMTRSFCGPKPMAFRASDLRVSASILLSFVRRYNQTKEDLSQ